MKKSSVSLQSLLKHFQMSHFLSFIVLDPYSLKTLWATYMRLVNCVFYVIWSWTYLACDQQVLKLFLKTVLKTISKLLLWWLYKLTNRLPPIIQMRKLSTLFMWRSTAASHSAISKASELLLTVVACAVPWHKGTPYLRSPSRSVADV